MSDKCRDIDEYQQTRPSLTLEEAIIPPHPETSTHYFSSEQGTTEHAEVPKKPNIRKRALTEKYTSENVQEKQSNKSAASELRIQTTDVDISQPEPNKPSTSLVKSKRTKLIGEETFGESSSIASQELKLQFTYHCKVTDEQSQSEPPSASEIPKPTPLTKQEDKLIESLLKFRGLFEQDEDGDTPLHIAIVHNKSILTRGMIDAMVKRKHECPPSGLDIQNRLKQAALHLAVLTCQPDVVEYLAENGADVNLADRNGQTALHLACKNADREDVRALRKGVRKWNEKNQKEKETVENSININSRNFEGLAPIHLAALTGSCEVLGELLNMGGNIDLKDSTSGRTALHHAVEAHNPIVARFLLSCGADVNAQTFAGNTPLHTTSGRHMEAIISLLLEFKADPRLENAEGDPPLPEGHMIFSRAKRSGSPKKELTASK